MRYLYATLLFLYAITTFAQTSYTINGRISNSENTEALVGVSVGIKEMPQHGSFSDNKGDFALLLPQGEYTLIFKLIGYNTKQIKIKVDKNKTQNITL